MKAALWTTAWLWTTLGLHHMYPEQVETVLANTVHYTDQILAWTWECINEWANSLLSSTVWSSAPFAWAMIPTVLAWWYGMKKLADVMKIEKKWLRNSMIIWWWAVWAWLSTTVMAPYLVWWALATALAKPVYNLSAWALKYTGKWLSWIYGWVVWTWWGLLKWAWKWAVNWVKEWYKDPSFKPNVWF